MAAATCQRNWVSVYCMRRYLLFAMIGCCFCRCCGWKIFPGANPEQHLTFTYSRVQLGADQVLRLGPSTVRVNNGFVAYGIAFPRYLKRVITAQDGLFSSDISYLQPQSSSTRRGYADDEWRQGRHKDTASNDNNITLNKLSTYSRCLCWGEGLSSSSMGK